RLYVRTLVNSPGAERNRLLAALSIDEQAQLATCMEPACLEAHQVLAYPEEPLTHVYFPSDAVVTLLVPMQDGAAVEGATIGKGGLMGLAVFFGVALPNEEMEVQIPGDA